jgi:hypothetical protein
MAKRQPGDDVGLPWAAKAKDVSPVMREIARAALRQKLTYGDLKRRLNEVDGKNRSTKNVSAHFRSKRPRAEILHAYAEIVGLSAPHISLLQGKLLTFNEARELLAEAVRYLLSKSTRFKKGTAEKVRAAVAALLKQDQTLAQRLASEVALAGYREAVGLPGDRATSHPEFAEHFGMQLTAFAEAIRPQINLFEAVANRDQRLAKIWVLLGWLFHDERDSEKIMDEIIRILKRRGINTAKMEANLREVQANLTEALRIPTRVPRSSDFEL